MLKDRKAAHCWVDSAIGTNSRLALQGAEHYPTLYKLDHSAHTLWCLGPNLKEKKQKEVNQVSANLAEPPM